VRAAVYISLVLLGSLALANLDATADIAGAASGSVSGLMNMGAQIGGAVAASLTPWIASRLGWTASFLVAAALCLVGAFSWLVVNPTGTLSPAHRLPVRRSTYVSDQTESRSRVTRASS
jgi:cyanate permease